MNVIRPSMLGPPGRCGCGCQSRPILPISFAKFWIGANARSYRRRATLRAPGEPLRASSGRLSSRSRAVGGVSDRGWKVGCDADRITEYLRVANTHPPHQRLGLLWRRGNSRMVVMFELRRSAQALCEQQRKLPPFRLPASPSEPDLIDPFCEALGRQSLRRIRRRRSFPHGPRAPNAHPAGTRRRANDLAPGAAGCG